MSDDGRTDAATGDGDDAGGAPETGTPETATTGGAEGGTYPAEKLDLGGGTSDGDTPSTDDGG